MKKGSESGVVFVFVCVVFGSVRARVSVCLCMRYRGVFVYFRAFLFPRVSPKCILLLLIYSNEVIARRLSLSIARYLVADNESIREDQVYTSNLSYASCLSE